MSHNYETLTVFVLFVEEENRQIESGNRCQKKEATGD